MALKKALINADLFFADNSKPTHRDDRTNKRDIIDYIIFSPAIFNKIRNLTLNNDVSLITLLSFSTFKLTSTNLYFLSSRSNYITKLILQEQILNLISSENADPINIINTAATILSDTILNIYNNLPEKIIKPNTSIPLPIQLLIKQKRKIKRAFIKTRNPFIKSALNAITKKN